MSNNDPQPAAPPPGAQALLDAMEKPDLPLAQRLAEAMGPAPTAEQLPVVAELYFRLKKWDQAARFYGRIADLDVPGRLKQMFARNRSAIGRHRPELEAVLNAVQDTAPYQILSTPAGFPTLARTENGKTLILSSTSDPRQGLTESFKKLSPGLQEDCCFGIFSLGDGYLLTALARHRPPLTLGMEQCVHVFEPHPQHLLALLFIHDLSADTGPLAQQRFRFWIGPDWAERYLEALTADPTIPVPTRSITQGPTGAEVEKRVAAIERKLAEDLAQRQRRVVAADESRRAGELASLFSDHPPRRPRMLMFTSRFTTVLQYSTRDSAEALEAMGWQTRLVMEPSGWQRVTPRAILGAIEDFAPDGVLVIDHLRREYGGLFPPNLPFLCWIQDQLSNLTHPQAGASIGKRDFVLTPVAPMYAGLWGYPERQLVDLPQLTRVPRRPESWTSDGDDLCYVANAWKPIPHLVTEALATAGQNADLRRLVERCCQCVIEVYERGENLPTLWHMGRLVDAVAAELGQTPPANPLRPQLVNILTHPLNNALYRLQALRWIKAIANRMGLRFSLYGRGWEGQAEFGSWARGPVEPGQPLGQLVRRTKINLQIVPSICLHPRLLDGLAAGGFFLVRHHPSDDLLPAVSRFLRAQADDSVQSTEQLTARLGSGSLAEFQHLLEQARCMTDLGQPIDLIQWVRCCERAGLLDERGDCLPELSPITFRDEQALQAAVQMYLNNDSARRRIADRQRQSIEHRLSYPAGLSRALRAVGRLLSQET